MFVFFRIGVTNSFNKQSNKTLYTSKSLTYFSSYFLLYWIFLTGNNVCWVVLSTPKLACIFSVHQEGLGMRRLDGCAIPQQFSNSRQNFFLNYSLKKFRFFFQFEHIHSEVFFTYCRTLKNQSTTYLLSNIKVITNKIISNGGIPLILFLFSAISNRRIQKKRNKYKTNISQRYLNGRREFDSITAGQALILLPPMEKQPFRGPYNLCT